MGRHMVAIIDNPTISSFDLIAYQQKDKILIRETLGEALAFYKYSNNFIAFTDRHKHVWNLSFDNIESFEAFIQCVCKHNSPIIDNISKSAQKEESTSSIKTSLETKEITNSKEQSSKDKILSRITKLGQPILPKRLERSKSSELSDSETETSSSDPLPVKPVVAPRKAKRNLNSQDKSLAPVLLENNNPLNNNIFVPNNHLMLNHQNPALVYTQPLPDLNFGNYIVAQNAELKANLAEINLKLNRVLNNRDNNGNCSEDVTALQTRIKCQNLKIDNLSTDYQRMRSDFEILKEKYDQKCQELDKSLTTKKQVDVLEAELVSLRETAKNEELLLQRINELKGKLSEHEELIASLNERNSVVEGNNANQIELQKESENLRLQVEEQKLKIDQLQLKLKKQEENAQMLDKEKINRVVKESMNKAYRGIMENFDDRETYSLSDIHSALLENLKNTSYTLINSLS
ncbi:putative leucine-rich repeat-containing protein DDB_G0290503 isoform X2 [Euwallacea similis]